MRGLLMMVRLAWPQLAVMVLVAVLAFGCQRTVQPPVQAQSPQGQYPDPFRVVGMHVHPTGQNIELVVFCDEERGVYVYWHPEGGVAVHAPERGCR